MAAVRPTLGRQRVPPHGQRHPGIHAIEIYVPRHCVQAQALEAEHGVPGKYTEGLMMEQWALLPIVLMIALDVLGFLAIYSLPVANDVREMLLCDTVR